MLLWLLSSFVFSEAIVGIILTVLLVLGKASSTNVVDVVSFAGFLILAVGLLPFLHKVRGLSFGGIVEKKTDEEETTTEAPRSRIRDFAKKNANLLQAVLVGGIVFGMGLGLFYLTGPF